MNNLYPILDTAALHARNSNLTMAARAFLEGGAQMIQIRHKDHWPRETFAEAEAVAALCRRFSATLIVNDRVDIALLLGAGVHLGQDDLPVTDARRLLGSERVIGLSTHNVAQLTTAESEPVDYIALGPVFGTISKANPDLIIGLERFREWRALVSRPVVAIGGITRENALDVLAAGADSVAVIGDLLPDSGTPAAFRERMEAWGRVVNCAR